MHIPVRIILNFVPKKRRKYDDNQNKKTTSLYTKHCKIEKLLSAFIYLFFSTFITYHVTDCSLYKAIHNETKVNYIL